jgi:7-cyano-7-deazaguanine synthase
VRTDRSSAGDALVLLSGGLDSTVALAMAASGGPRPVAALFFDYGQHAARREASAARRVAAHYGCDFERVALPWLAGASSSRLVAGTGATPARRRSRLGKTSPREVWVENRNGIFIAIAALYAAERGCAAVIAGFNREEARAFPDNTEAFLRRTNRALEFGVRARVRVASPTIRLAKREIVLRGIELGVPGRHVWSCYRGGARMCGTCESCLRLRRAVAGTAAARLVRFGKRSA